VELCALSFRRDDWSNSVMVAMARFGDGAGELTAAVALTRRGAETKLVLPGLAPQK
jgi:predicted naringenin-chalcone synthase